MTTDVNPDEFLENVHLQGFIKRLDQFEESMRSLVEGLKEHDTKLNDLESKIDASIEEFKEDLLINELNDFQVKLDRLENQLLDTRRHTATGAMTEHANSAFNFLSRMRDFEPTHASEAQDCPGLLKS